MHPSSCSISPMIVQPLPVMPSTYNSAFSCPFRRPSCSKAITTNQKSLDPFAYRITVRRMTPSHIATAAADASKKQSNNDSDRTHLEQSNQTMATNHLQFKTTETTNTYKKDHFDSNNENIPSIPSRKIVPKNNGIQVSSTSFISTTDDRKSFTSDDVSENAVEHFITSARLSNNENLALFELNSVSSSIDPVLSLDKKRMSTDEAIATINDEIDEPIILPKENLITKQTQSTRSNAIEKHLFIQAQPSTDKVKRNNRHSTDKELSYQYATTESNIDTTVTSNNKLVVEPLFVDLSQSPQLPSSFPPDINTIKSNEMLVNSSRSLASLHNEKANSSTNIRKSGMPLRNARSTLDFGLIIDETVT